MKLASTLFAFALLAPVLSAQEAPEAPKHTYRATFTLTDTESGKKVGSQKVAMVLNSGPQSSTIKLGSRVPITTGSYSSTTTTAVQTQFTYLDIGLNINATLRELSNGLEIVAKVEESGVADGPSTVPQEPIIRQTMLQNSAMLTLGKSLLIGSLDIPGSTRHTDIEVLLERVP